MLREERGLRWLLAARTVSGLGDWFTYFLMVVLAYERTGQPAGSMVILAAQAIATLLFSAWAGPLVDRRPPAVVMVMANVARMGLVGLLFWMPVSPLLYSADAFAVATAAAFFNPADGKWVRTLLSPERYGSGIALLQVLGQVVQIVGPGLAVTVLALLEPRPRGGFLLDSISFLLAACLVWRSYRVTARRPGLVGKSPTPPDRAAPAPPKRLTRQWAELLPP